MLLEYTEMELLYLLWKSTMLSFKWMTWKQETTAPRSQKLSCWQNIEQWDRNIWNVVVRSLNNKTLAGIETKLISI